MDRKHHTTNSINCGRNNKMKRIYWAYRQTNGTVKVKPYTNVAKIDKHAIEDAYASDFIEDVVENIEANNINEAFKQARKEFAENV